MKKNLFFVGIAAAAMLASCSNDETVEMPQSKAISFNNAFVNNGTRSVVDPSFTKANLGSFAVYGFTQNGQIFDGQSVTSSDEGETWTYTPSKYWIEGNTYTFAGIAPANTPVSGETVSGNKVHMTVNFTNENGTTDLLYAAPGQVTADEDFLGNIQPVDMTFNHQLSKVKFSFINAVGESYNIKVTNVKVTDAKKTGTLTIGETNEWSNQTGNAELDFGNVITEDDKDDNVAAIIANGKEGETYNERLMIPMNNTGIYTVTFSVELFDGAVSTHTYNHEVTIQNVELKPNFSYDFKATLTAENITEPDDPTLQKIEFDVTDIEGWKNYQEETVNVPATQVGE